MGWFTFLLADEVPSRLAPGFSLKSNELCNNDDAGYEPVAAEDRIFTNSGVPNARMAIPPLSSKHPDGVGPRVLDPELVFDGGREFRPTFCQCECKGAPPYRGLDIGDRQLRMLLLDLLYETLLGFVQGGQDRLGLGAGFFAHGIVSAAHVPNRRSACYYSLLRSLSAGPAITLPSVAKREP